MDREAWRLTLELLDRCDPDADPRVVALAHLGAAVMLFAECDPATGEAILGLLGRSEGLGALLS